MVGIEISHGKKNRACGSIGMAAYTCEMEETLQGIDWLAETQSGSASYRCRMRAAKLATGKGSDVAELTARKEVDEVECS